MEVISVEHVSKVYRIYEKNEDRMKEALNPLGKKYHNDFYALKDISFCVEKGETVGIIGTNGSGKSTILKIISKVLKQSSGNVTVSGKVSSLLELGVGFDEECTGLENIFINGSLMGFTKKEMNQKLNEILEFADIGDFINQPVKTYSSGMLVRLAFSLAINVEPEILIIDEALAVGDIFFQAKCFHRLEQIKRSGTTILFVSHDIGTVKKLCSRAIWIEGGKLIENGESGKVCDKYMSYQISRQNVSNERLLQRYGDTVNAGENNQFITEVLTVPAIKSKADTVSGTGKAEILSAFFRDYNGNITKTIVTKKLCSYCMVIQFNEKIQLPLFGFELETNKGVRVYGVNNYMLHQELREAEANKKYYVEFRLELPRLHSGHYLITPAVASGVQECHVVHHRLHNFETVIVENDGFDNALIELDADFSIKECSDNMIFIERAL